MYAIRSYYDRGVVLLHLVEEALRIDAFESLVRRADDAAASSMSFLGAHGSPPEGLKGPARIARSGPVV